MHYQLSALKIQAPGGQVRIAVALYYYKNILSDIDFLYAFCHPALYVLKIKLN
jgi:hypothetical protein